MEYLDCAGLNTSNVDDLSSMFLGCSSLTNLDISGFDTAHAARMGSMFERCSSLVTLVVGSGWNSDNVSNNANKPVFDKAMRSLAVGGASYTSGNVIPNGAATYRAS